MVYWIDFGKGYRVRGYESIVKTRQYAMDVMDENHGIPVAYMFPSKNSTVIDGVISRHDGYVWFSKKSKRFYKLYRNGKAY